jgi:hypothetical protein
VQRYLSDQDYVSADIEWMAWNGTYLNGTETQDHISDSPNRTFPMACVYQINLQRKANEWFSYGLNVTILHASSIGMEPLKVSTRLANSQSDQSEACRLLSLISPSGLD